MVTCLSSPGQCVDLLNDHLFFVSANIWLSYIPMSGKFCRDLDKLLTAALPSDNLMVMGDPSTHVLAAVPKCGRKLLNRRRLVSSCVVKQTQPKNLESQTAASIIKVRRKISWISRRLKITAFHPFCLCFTTEYQAVNHLNDPKTISTWYVGHKSIDSTYKMNIWINLTHRK